MNVFYRVIVCDQHGIELQQLGVFEKKEEALFFKKLHRFEVAEPDQIHIQEYRPEHFARCEADLPEYVFVTFDSFVRTVYNPTSDPFIDTEERNWCLDSIKLKFEDLSNVPELGPDAELQTTAFVTYFEDDGPALSHIQVTFPVQTKLLIHTSAIEVDLVQAKLKVVASKVFSRFSQICKDTKVEDPQKAPRIILDFDIKALMS